MSSNRKAKQKLIELYGPECFIEKLHLRHDETPRHYTSKKQMRKMKQLTYHHIKEKRNGGKATVENGALLSEENHEWFNQQSKEVQAELNKKFQEYKACKIVLVDDLEVPYEIKAVEIVPTETELTIITNEDMTPDEKQKYEEHKRQRNERIKKKFKETER